MAEYIVERHQTSDGWQMIEPKGELIRCKECIYRDWGGFCTGFGEGQYVGDDSYCSNGEREEE